jgi:hypothetical protein
MGCSPPYEDKTCSSVPAAILNDGHADAALNNARADGVAGMHVQSRAHLLLDSSPARCTFVILRKACSHLAEVYYLQNKAVSR